MLLSIVIPCYNEEQVLRTTHERLTHTLGALRDTQFELIFVDDGSRDNTFQLLSDLQSADSRVRVLRLSRNFGHQMAVTAGLEAATGDAVVVMDADLQDPPELIPEMVAIWRKGHHVVYGKRVARAGESHFKLVTAKFFYRLINTLSDTDIPFDAGDFRLLDRKVIDVLLSMPERDRFLRGMASWAGFRQTALPYRREPRFAGKSKYPLLKMIRFASDGIISFSFSPLRLATWAGLSAVVIAFAGITYAVVLRVFTNDWVRGWASIFVAILFLGGVQLISLGIIGEYLGRIYTEVKRRPLYVVDSRIGFNKPNSNDEV